MVSLERNDIGSAISAQIESAPGFSAEYFVFATTGCEVLAGSARFSWMLQEFINNCAEKETDSKIQIGVRVNYEAPTDMLTMSVEDNVAYERDYAEQLVTILNGAKISHKGKRHRDEVSKEDAAEKWMFVPHMRRVLRAWGGDLVFSVADDNTIKTDVTWNKTMMQTVRPPQLNAGDVFRD